MKILSNLLFLSTILLSIPLGGMDNSAPKAVAKIKKIYSLKKLAYYALSQQLKEELKKENPILLPIEPLEETAKLILRYLKLENFQERNDSLKKIPLKTHLKIVNLFLKNLTNKIKHDEDHEAKISYIYDYSMLAPEDFLAKFRLHICGRSKRFNKLCNLIPVPCLTQDKIKSIEEKSDFLKKLIDINTELLMSKALAISDQEDIPVFDIKFEKKAVAFILEQNQLNWELVNEQLLLKKEINPKSFFMYLFAKYITHMNFDKSDTSYIEKCEAMNRIISQILTACAGLFDAGEQFNYLIQTYPRTAHLLYSFNDDITVQMDRPEIISSTLLCPKLLLMECLKTKFLMHLSKKIIESLSKEQVQEAADILRSTYYFFCDRIIMLIVAKNILKEIDNLPINIDIKSHLLRHLASTLNLCISDIGWVPKMISELRKYYEYSIKKTFKKSENRVVPQELIALFKATFI